MHLLETGSHSPAPIKCKSLIHIEVELRVLLSSLCWDSGWLDLVQTCVYSILTNFIIHPVTKTHQAFLCIYVVRLSIWYNMRSNKKIFVCLCLFLKLCLCCVLDFQKLKPALFNYGLEVVSLASSFSLLGYDKRYSEKSRSHKLCAECLLC